MILATPHTARPHTRASHTAPPPTCACPCAGFALGEPKRRKTQPHPRTCPATRPASCLPLPSSQLSPTECFPGGRAQPDIGGSSSILGAPRGQGRALAPCTPHPAWAHNAVRLSTTEGLGPCPQPPEGRAWAYLRVPRQPSPRWDKPPMPLVQGLAHAECSGHGHYHE